ncbi:hypothetical protein ELS19_19445 [Halogeometricum borinquense]|uniref:Uncharacterized protein n=1 Tax=Halogeometricum borinquense TaxID=60847 RepID=A0A482T6Y1_9EURY|nr:hypothetical protein [Halogeometricum borinquense]RYJ08657.1 hypothetical protein ELS19_19445 [Halogeometricum borinquense]
MLTRRQTVIGISGFLITGGIISSAASEVTSSSTNASFSVVYERSITLTPATDPPVHVQTNEAGYVTAITPGEGTGVSQRAITRFEDIVRVTNVGTVGISGLTFSFAATSDTLSDDALADIESALAVTADGETLSPAGESGDNLLEMSERDSVADGVLDPGESVPFGVQINLVPDSGRGTLSDLPDGEYDIELRIAVERDETAES